MKFAGTYQASAARATTIVENAGVRKRGWIAAKRRGKASARPIENVVREAGMIVVCVEEIAEMTIASTTILSHGVPSTPAPSTAKMLSSSAKLSSSPTPAKATTAVVTAT